MREFSLLELFQRWILLAACFLTPIGAAALDVRTSHAEGVDFAGYHTWAWQAVERAADHPLAEGSALDRQVRAAIEGELGRQGLSRVDADPDLWIAYDGAVTAEYAVSGTHIDYGVLDWAGYGASEMGEMFQRGMLSLTFTDAASGEAVWRGLATKVDRQPSPETMARRAEKAIGRMLREFPPR